jgi:glycosyltransferase involved in cell wall biosynthesis
VKSSVCLATICKTEEKTIKRMLDSVIDLIDGYLIIDTGSKDHTRTVIKKYFEKHDIPGELRQEPWENFAVNRTSLVRQASEMGCDYLLLMDADCTLEAHEGDFDDLTGDAYMIDIPSPQMTYKLPYLVASRIPWRYESPTHEYLTADTPFLTVTHPTLRIFHHADGGTRPEKFDRDRALLEKEYTKDPTNPRTVFYLATTYQGIGDKDGAIRLFRQRSELGGWDEEVYWSLLQVAYLTGSTDDYLKAHTFRPHRPEAIQRLMKRFNEMRAYDLSVALWTGYSPELTNDKLFVETWCHTYGIKFEAALALWWTGHIDVARQFFEALLARPDLPDDYRQLCEHNLTFCEIDDD